MLLVDSDLVLSSCRTPAGAMALISRLERRARCERPSDVVVAVSGVGPSDVIERRRREAFVHPDSRAVQALPGAQNHVSWVTGLTGKGWNVQSSGGCCCLATLALWLRDLERSTSRLTLFAGCREADALISLCPVRLACSRAEGYEREYVLAPALDHSGLCCTSDCVDSVILDILTGGGLVQALPSLPRMHLSKAVHAIHRAYTSWRSGMGRQGALAPGYKLDRTALAQVMDLYVDEGEGGENDTRLDGETPRWRSTYEETHFPHGFDGACAEYLEALERELCHLSGMGGSGKGVYIHGCAPSALHLSTACKPCTSSPSLEPRWSAELQLAAILPSSSYLPHPPPNFHTRLDMGCVHMYPVCYQVWWGTYPVIPALDVRLLQDALWS